jgi:hypothetical protein
MARRRRSGPGTRHRSPFGGFRAVPVLDFCFCWRVKCLIHIVLLAIDVYISSPNSGSNLLLNLLPPIGPRSEVFPIVLAEFERSIAVKSGA